MGETEVGATRRVVVDHVDGVHYLEIRRQHREPLVIDILRLTPSLAVIPAGSSKTTSKP